MTKGAYSAGKTGQPAIIQKAQAQQSSTPLQQSLIKGQAPKDGPQKVQIIRGPDGNITVRGLIAGQQLVETPDGKLHVIVSNQMGSTPVGGQVIATGGAPPTPKIAVTPAIKPHAKPNNITQILNKATPISTPGNKVVLKAAPRLVNAIQTMDNKLVNQTAQRIITQGGQQILVQGGQQILVQPSQHVVVQGQPRLVQQQGTIIQQGTRPMQTMVVQGGTQLVQGQVLQAGQQIIQGQLVQSGQQVLQGTPIIQGQQILRPAQPQQQVVNRIITSGHQIVINNPNLAQQLAAGKLQLATINGQQVLIRPTGNNQAQVVAHITPQPQNTLQAVTPQNQVNAPQIQQNQMINAQPNQVVVAQQNLVQQTPQLQQVVQAQVMVSPVKQLSPTPQLTEEQLMEQRLLVGQPPGTVIKTVTAQVNSSQTYYIF